MLAQKLLEQSHWPYLSIDHLKMRLVRSGKTELTPLSEDADLTAYLWSVVRVENGQHLIVEGCYIPFDWRRDFDERYLKDIEYFCLVMTERSIRTHFSDIKKYADTVEKRLDDSGCTLESALADNAEVLSLAQKHQVRYLLIDDRYEVDLELPAVR